MLNKIKKLKVDAIKAQTPEGKIAKDAYNAVISSIETAQGKLVNGKLIVVDDALVISTIKKEIKVFRESVSSNPEVLKEYELKAQVLEKLLPEQLTKEDILWLFKEYDGDMNPKAFMQYLDKIGYTGSYNKGDAAAVVLKK